MTDLRGEGVRVVLVGTGTHVASSILPDVPAVPATVQALRHALIDVCGVRAKNLVELIDPKDPEAFLDNVLPAASAATDVLVIYYVGHGVLNSTGELHLATRATVDLRTKATYQALPFKELAEALSNSRASMILVILDCCYSNRAQSPVTSGALLVSADVNEHALASPGEPYTAFTGQLITTLQEGIDKAPAQLRLKHVFDNLYRIMRARKGPLPDLRTGNRTGELVLAPNRAYRTPSVVPSDSEPQYTGDCPYRGLAPYTVEDEHLFFGRTALIERTVARLRQRAQTGGITILGGSSGCGKTSLLSAGVLPAIARGDLGITGASGWRHLAMAPGEDPVGHLADKLAELDSRHDSTWIRSKLIRGGDEARDAFVQAVASLGASDGELPGRLIVAVDQFEELFAPTVPESERRIFVAALDAASTAVSGDSAALVIVALRSDFDGECLRFPALAHALENNQVVVGPMTTRQLRSTVQQPAELEGLILEPGLLDVVIRDAGGDSTDEDTPLHDPGTLPLLSHALLSTWQHRRGNVLTVEGYRQARGVIGALAATAEDTFASLSPGAQRVAEKLLTRMVRISDDGPDTRRRLPAADFDTTQVGRSMESEVLEAFAKARLVTLDEGGAQIAHEALIRAWSRLQDWINTDRAARFVLQELETDAEAWRRSDHDNARLYRGSRLATARQHVGLLDQEQSATASVEFLTASHTQERRGVHVRRLAVTALVMLLVLTTTAATAAINREQRLQQQLIRAEADDVAREAMALSQGDPVGAAQLALAAWQADPSGSSARAALAMSYLAMRSVETELLLPSVISGFAASRDGDVMVASAGSSIMAVSGLSGADPDIWSVPGIPDSASFALSPDGSRLAAFDDAGALLTWDLQARTNPRVVHTGDDLLTEAPHSFRFAADSSRLVVLTEAPAGGGPEVAVVDVDTGGYGPRMTLPAGTEATAVWATRDIGSVLLSTGRGENEQLELYSTADGALIRTFPYGSSVVDSGLTVVSCIETLTPVDTVPAQFVMLDSTTGAEKLRVATNNTICGFDNYQISRDGQYIVEIELADLEPIYQEYYLTSTADGSRINFTVPPIGSIDYNSPIATRTADLAVIAGVSPKATVARGSAVLRLAGEAVPRLPPEFSLYQDSYVSDDGRYLIIHHTEAGIIVLDRRTGAQKGQLPRDKMAPGALSVVADRVVLFSGPISSGNDAQWTMETYSLPELGDRTSTSWLGSLDESGEAPGAATVADGETGEVISLLEGRLHFWDMKSGRNLRLPLKVGDPKAEPGWRSPQLLSVRPGHDEVAFATPTGAVEIWSTHERRRISTLSVSVSTGWHTLTWDETGDRLAFLAADASVQVWSINERRMLNRIIAPDGEEVVAFTPDGYLVTVGSGAGENLRFWDLSRNVEAGSMALSSATLFSIRADEMWMHVDGTDERLPQTIAITAQGWFDAVCRAADRAFTEEELRLLPSAFEVESPCRT